MSGDSIHHIHSLDPDVFLMITVGLWALGEENHREKVPFSSPVLKIHTINMTLDCEDCVKLEG